MTTSPASDRIADFGLDGLCEAVANGLTMRAIASSIGVSFGTLSLWIGAQPDRSARVRDGRQHAAQLWDEKAEKAIIDATDQLGVSKARELAQHYRWRASKIAPREYGNKMDLNHGGQAGNLIQVVTGMPRSPGDPVPGDGGARRIKGDAHAPLGHTAVHSEHSARVRDV